MHRRLSLALALALTAGSGMAADPAGRFGIVLVFTDRTTDAAYERPDALPKSIKVAPRGNRLGAKVFFRDCKPDDKGLCKVELDTIAHTPDGKVYGFRTDSQFWQGKPPAPGVLQLGPRGLGLVIDSGDPAGTWNVTVTARDRIANIESSAVWRFEVEPE